MEKILRNKTEYKIRNGKTVDGGKIKISAIRRR
jgi:hypothetical protein